MTPGAPRNVFGACHASGDTAARIAALGIGAADRVLEVGGAGNPFSRADVICDLSFSSCAQRNGAPGVFRDDVEYVEAPVEALPFPDGAFDFVYCTQVLEHVQDPVAAGRELSRVAARGFVEVPSRLGEMVCGNPTHRWIVDREGDVLVFHPRPFVEHPLNNFFYGVLFRDPELRRLSEVDYRNLFNHQILFRGALEIRVAVADHEVEVFDYEDAGQATRAHYSFARNVLAAGAEASYSYPDALEAHRLAPESDEAAALLAVHQARLRLPDEALATLRDVPGPLARELRGLIDGAGAGGSSAPETLPLPRATLGATLAARGIEARPLVSVVVAGSDVDLLQSSVESALTQDYPQVEVVVAAAADTGALEERFARLSMGDRLRVRPLASDTNVGRCLNQGALATRGAVLGFLLEGEQMLPHHIDRLMAQLLATGGGAVHADRILSGGEGVLGPDVVPGRPETAAASLSTLLARRETLEAVGFFDESRPGRRVTIDFLVRLAEAGVLDHLREATVTSSAALPPGVSALDEARAVMRLSPLELLRSLMAAHVREEGLRSRIASLEAELGRRREGEG